MKMDVICTDDRFELIQKYKEKLIQVTNIETAKEEMNVIDNILFRFWQMGWLVDLEKQMPKKPNEKGYRCAICPSCGGCVYLDKVQDHIINNENTYCEHCGQALDWRDFE